MRNYSTNPHSVQSREWKRRNPERAREVYRASQKRYRERKIGLPIGEYDRLFETQNGLCAICRRPGTVDTRYGVVRTLDVDHDHETGKIRGLLCNTCNKGLGFFDDDVDRIKTAIEYLS